MTLRRDSTWPLLYDVMSYPLGIAIPLHIALASHYRVRSARMTIIIPVVTGQGSMHPKWIMKGVSSGNIRK
jgi:hypothetical protein